jgi:hypothetical protein
VVVVMAGRERGSQHLARERERGKVKQKIPAFRVFSFFLFNFLNRSGGLFG